VLETAVALHNGTKEVIFQNRPRWHLAAAAVPILALVVVLCPAGTPPTFYKDVLPILQQHCQTCHRPGQIGPMSLLTYEQVRQNAKPIASMVGARRMPPWLADPKYGHFANDASLKPAEIETVETWVASGAPAGDPREGPLAKRWFEGWNIPPPDQVIQMTNPVSIPARGIVEYTYEIVPTGFTKDRWVQMSEIRPSSRAHVHHGVVYIRTPNSTWLRDAPTNTPFTASTLSDPRLQHEAHWTDSDLLLVYAPGSSPDQWPAGMAKFVPAGSDLVFQMHYTTNGHSARDQTSIGLVFAKDVPSQRVLTLQLTNDHFLIPPRTDNYRVEAWGTLPNDATLLSFFPHMHLRGKRFEYNIVHEPLNVETLLRVNYDFYWQLSYRLAIPRLLKAGTKLQAVAWYDNSDKNSHNPDPNASVTWGDQTYDEMMVGFFDIAVPRTMDKQQYFIRQ
jgi:hypothetical protein